MTDVFHWRDHEQFGTRAYVRAQLAAGRWRYLLPRVVLTSNGPPSERAKRRAALLYADGRQKDVAFLSHWTAAEELGFGLPRSDEVHVSTAAQVAAVPGFVAVHRVRTPPAAHVVLIRGLRCASIGRALMELAPRHCERDLRYLCARLVQQHRMARGYLVSFLDGQPQRPETGSLRAIAAGLTTGTKAGGELRLQRGLARRGWHASPNMRVTVPGGHTREGDLVLPAIKTVIQVESIAHHTLGLDAEADCTRDLDWAGVGYLTLRVWTRRIENDLEQLLDELVRALVARARELEVPLVLAQGRQSSHQATQAAPRQLG